jgi:hypothetical protein
MRGHKYKTRVHPCKTQRTRPADAARGERQRNCLSRPGPRRRTEGRRASPGAFPRSLRCGLEIDVAVKLPFEIDAVAYGLGARERDLPREDLPKEPRPATFFADTSAELEFPLLFFCLRHASVPASSLCRLWRTGLRWRAEEVFNFRQIAIEIPDQHRGNLNQPLPIRYGVTPFET